MSLKVIGAGLGRTGTMSLKIALEQLLDGPCYHMAELLQHHLVEHTPLWHAAARGEEVDWDRVFDGYVAAVDEPASIHWQSISRYYPDALVILSVRDPDRWFKSASETIFRVEKTPREELPPERRPWLDMVLENNKITYPNGIDNPEEVKAAFLAHIDRVKAGIPAERLLVWEAGDGWEPLCNALDLPVPDEPFPRTNTTEEFKARQTRAD